MKKLTYELELHYHYHRFYRRSTPKVIPQRDTYSKIDTVVYSSCSAWTLFRMIPRVQLGTLYFYVTSHPLYLVEKNRLTRTAPRWNNIRDIITTDDRFRSSIVTRRCKYFRSETTKARARQRESPTSISPRSKWDQVICLSKNTIGN